MLGADNFEGRTELLDELKQRAQSLVDKLEQGDFPAAAEMIRYINEARDHSIYREVGKLTRGLHDAIINFEIDASKVGAAEGDNFSKIANAQERLDYVINLTQKSADKTMDMVEQGIPVAEQIGTEARALQADWQRLSRRDMSPDEFRELYRRIDQFLGKTVDNSAVLSDKFNSILLAQDFQDLSGQVIKKVITLVQDVEYRLVDLMRVAGQVEQLTGIFRSVDVETVNKGADVAAEGPQIKAAQRADVVSGQDDVDDLLSSLGF
jgi:chemotaxis protein CheZ